MRQTRPVASVLQEANQVQHTTSAGGPGDGSRAPRDVPTAHSLKVLRDQEKERSNRWLFVQLCTRNDLPEPTSEYVFAKPRRWRFDFAWIQHRVALEVEGGAWSKGAHGRGVHFLSDIDKYNTATLLGWRLLRCVPGRLRTEDTIIMLRAALLQTNQERP